MIARFVAVPMLVMKKTKRIRQFRRQKKLNSVRKLRCSLAMILKLLLRYTKSRTLLLKIPRFHLLTKSEIVNELLVMNCSCFYVFIISINLKEKF